MLLHLVMVYVLCFVVQVQPSSLCNSPPSQSTLTVSVQKGHLIKLNCDKDRVKLTTVARGNDDNNM